MSRENLHRRDNSKSRSTMRGKLLEKQQATDEHESNFSAGRVNVRERYLHRTGIRGRKSWIFFCILYILVVVVLINLIMLVILYNVLQIDKDGMKCLSFFKTGKLRWTCLSDLEAVTLYKNQMGSFKDENMIFETDNGKVVIHGGPTTASAQLKIGAEETKITASSGFRFVEPYENKTILNLNGSVWFVQQEYVTASQVAAEALITPRVVSDENQNLTLTSENMAEVLGNEGIYLDGKILTFSSRNDVTITSTNAQEITIDAKDGVYISSRVPETPNGAAVSLLERFKLCACVNTGELFRVPVNSTVSSCKTLEKMC